MSGKASPCVPHSQCPCLFTKHWALKRWKENPYMVKLTSKSCVPYLNSGLHLHEAPSIPSGWEDSKEPRRIPLCSFV